MNKPLNAFTMPRGPAFTDKERRAMVKSQNARLGGKAGYEANNGQVCSTVVPKPPKK